MTGRSADCGYRSSQRGITRAPRMPRVRVRCLSRSRKGWRIRTLAMFPAVADALLWIESAGGTNGRYWIDRRQAPAVQEPRA